jgi:molecular chaperone GrpE
MQNETRNEQLIDPIGTRELGSDTSADFAALTAERDRLANEKAELHDRLLRRTAEFDNLRRRSERERTELIEYASMDAVKALLPILDDFERALKTETADKEFSRGMELIYGRLFDQLRKLGLEPIDTTGQKFDPNLHHAIEMAETPEAEDQAILAEFQRGYRLRGRLVRPAMVKVAVNG